MRHPIYVLHEIVAIFQRRKWLLLFPAIFVTVISAVGSLFLTRMFESSITILVQRSEVANPLASLANALAERNDDPLHSFDEIVYSDKAIVQLMDSLGLDVAVQSEVERRNLMGRIKKNIETKLSGAESFRITYSDTDPERAMKGVSSLANIFIDLSTRGRTARNDFAVLFYRQKLDEFGQKLHQIQQQILPTIQERARQMPGASSYLSTLEQQILDSETRSRRYKEQVQTIDRAALDLQTRAGLDALFELQRSGIPYAEELKTVLANYNEMAERFTPRHPEVVKARSQLEDLVSRITVALNTEIKNEQVRFRDLQDRRTSALNDMVRSSLLKQGDRSKEADFDLYQRLYDEMKMKLEEAEITKALGRNVENQFIVMNKAYLPLFPSKPNKTIITLVGFILGLALGLIAVIVAELFDTTIWVPHDIEVYHKPIIALLPEAGSSKHK